MLQPGALATKVLCLTQVVEVDELSNDEDYQDILEDMRTECGKFGGWLDKIFFPLVVLSIWLVYLKDHPL